MKTMRYLSMAALALLGAVMTGCSSDDLASEASQQPKDKIVTVTTTVGLSSSGNTTRALNAEGKKTFAVGDQVAISYQQNGQSPNDAWSKAVSNPLTADDISADGKKATLTFTLVNPKENDTFYLVYPAAMADATGDGDYTKLATQDGTLASLAKNLDLATGTGVLNGVELPYDVELDNKLAVLAITLKNSDGSSDITSTITSVTISDGTNTYTVSRSAAAGPIYVAIQAATNAEFRITATDGTNNYTKTVTGKTYIAGNFYQQGLLMAEPEVAGEYFTSKSDGTKVVFSPGNLQYQASTNTWRFAEHQYDYVGDATNGNVYVGSTKSNNASISSTYNGWIDLFGWGTSNKTFASGYGSATQPWSTSINQNAYGPTGTSNGLYGAFANGDWGVNMTGPYTWRTLTGGSGGEWEYIFSTRTSGATVNGTSNARYTEATINTDGTPVNGMILFPDGCNINSSSATSWGNINSASTWNNATKCTTSQWTHLEKLGCVFLPAAGLRDYGTVMDKVGSFGIYWSSSPYASNPIYAHLVRIYEGVVDPAIFGNRWNGFSVRLVREVAAPAPAYTMAAAATTSDKGKLICTAGHIHVYGEDAACTAGRVAKIIYVGPTGHATYTHGLALALEDMSTDPNTEFSWDNSGANNGGKTAAELCSAWNTSKHVTDAEWLLASKDQWNYMLDTNGAGSYTALRDGFTSVGGSNLQSKDYWSSTEYEYNTTKAWSVNLGYECWYDNSKDRVYPMVRACLAF